jgi:hypothetical protein
MSLTAPPPVCGEEFCDACGELHLKPGYSLKALHNTASAVDEGWGELAARVCAEIGARLSKKEPW